MGAARIDRGNLLAGGPDAADGLSLAGRGGEGGEGRGGGFIFSLSTPPSDALVLHPLHPSIHPSFPAAPLSAVPFSLLHATHFIFSRTSGFSPEHLPLLPSASACRPSPVVFYRARPLPLRLIILSAGQSFSRWMPQWQRYCRCCAAATLCN